MPEESAIDPISELEAINKCNRLKVLYEAVQTAEGEDGKGGGWLSAAGSLLAFALLIYFFHWGVIPILFIYEIVKSIAESGQRDAARRLDALALIAEQLVVDYREHTL